MQINKIGKTEELQRLELPSFNQGSLGKRGVLAAYLRARSAPLLNGRRNMARRSSLSLGPATIRHDSQSITL